MSKMTAADMIRLAGQYTVARMLERDDLPSAIVPSSQSLFMNSSILWCRATTQWRWKLILSWVALIRVQSSDGRILQKHYGQKPQAILTVPILEGLDGVQKMSKSLGNYVGVSDSPGEMYTKLLSMPDELLWRYFELLSFRPMAEIEQFKAAVAGGENPQDYKKVLAEELITRFHDEEAAKTAHKSAGNRVALGEIPDNVPVVEVSLEVRVRFRCLRFCVLLVW